MNRAKYQYDIEQAEKSNQPLSELYSPQQINYYKNAYTHLLNRDPETKGDPNAALAKALTPEQRIAYEQSMGPELYQQLITDLQNAPREQVQQIDLKPYRSKLDSMMKETIEQPMGDLGEIGEAPRYSTEDIRAYIENLNLPEPETAELLNYAGVPKPEEPKSEVVNDLLRELFPTLYRIRESER